MGKVRMPKESCKELLGAASASLKKNKNGREKLHAFGSLNK